MVGACIIILSCYVNSFDAKKTAACAINANEIVGVIYEPQYESRYMLHMKGRYPRFSTIVETPSKVKELADKCKQGNL